MIPAPAWTLQLGLAAVLLAGAWLHGCTHGDAAARAELQAQAEADAESNRLRARAAATGYETQRAARARGATPPSPEVRNALHAPICPPAGPSEKPLELGDVPVPGAVLDRLRAAGADF